ncbi:hypothetical protein Vadar_010215 [Vaccinium darrowii]|uniref:Uncharacterized protein n=1 Tax=Vaccinium darrowii TaxID=229202 RepID=A0ACB7XGX0_9ERIC|nr:hypothetical protein Vadar_010215 [Vaccinium darrowii]
MPDWSRGTSQQLARSAGSDSCSTVSPPPICSSAGEGGLGDDNGIRPRTGTCGGWRWVLLAPSTRACCEGITLVGASRVVLLDVVWNSSVKWKTISRAYRTGQKKVVYIYRLIMSGTMEGEKCVVQAEKDRLSELAFSSADGKDHGSEIISCAVNDDKILQEMVQHEKISYRFAKILNQPKESNLIDTFG